MTGRKLWALVATLAMLGTVWLTGCTAGGRESGPTTQPPLLEPPPGPESQVPVVLFFAHEGKLVSTLRSITAREDAAPAAAMAALIAGPTPAEVEGGLTAVLPPSTRVIGVKVEGNVATVDLSREVITAAPEVRGGSTAEALALQATYLTMVQFPGVEKVKLLIEGRAKGSIGGQNIEDFWGHVGLPEYLEGAAVPVLQLASRQQIGEGKDGYRLKSVRWWAHQTLFRVVFEVEKQTGKTTAVPVTVASYATVIPAVKLTLSGMRESAVPNLSPGQEIKLEDWRASSLLWEKESANRSYSFQLNLQPSRAYGWRLWSLADPARVVLDVYSAGPVPGGTGP